MALDHAMAQLNENTNDLDIDNVPVLLTLIKEAFGDSDPTSTAIRELHHLKQGKGNFSTFHVQFSRLVEKQKFNKNGKHDALEQAMREEIKAAMLHDKGDNSDYGRFVQKLQKFSNNFHAR